METQLIEEDDELTNLAILLIKMEIYLINEETKFFEKRYLQKKGKFQRYSEWVYFDQIQHQVYLSS